MEAIKKIEAGKYAQYMLIFFKHLSCNILTRFMLIKKCMLYLLQNKQILLIHKIFLCNSNSLQFFKGSAKIEPPNVNTSFLVTNPIPCNWSLSIPSKHQKTYFQGVQEEISGIICINSFVPNAPFLYAMKTSENCKVF